VRHRWGGGLREVPVPSAVMATFAAGGFTIAARRLRVAG